MPFFEEVEIEVREIPFLELLLVLVFVDRLESLIFQNKKDFVDVNGKFKGGKAWKSLSWRLRGLISSDC